MTNFTGQPTYAVDEIKAKFPYGLPDWESTDFEPFIGEPITWAQFHQAFPSPEAEVPWIASAELSSFENAPEQPDPSAWNDDPFARIENPFGAYLEPEGYAVIHAMKKPNARSYALHMPRTVALANTIYDAIPEADVWGRQRPKSNSAWETITAGKWVGGVKKGKPYNYEQKAMTPWDVLKMLADPKSLALANKDTAGDRFSRVRHVRIDIDMDCTFDHDGQDHLPELKGEIALVRGVFVAFGLCAQVFRTGNRGIQAVAPIPSLDRSVAWVLTECVRTVLRDCRSRRE